MDNYMKFATFNHPDTIPVSAFFYDPTLKRYGKALEELILRYPHVETGYKPGDYAREIQFSGQYAFGRSVDHWGCVWENKVAGHDAICVSGPLTDLSLVDELPLPERDAGLEHGLMFLRLTYLRGYENAMMDFFEESPAFFRLIEKVVAYNLRQVALKLDQMGQDEHVVTFGDDLGMQRGLPIGAERWRRILKPCFARLFKPCKDKGKLVFMHTDGCIHEIIPDLRDCGVDIINPQVGANGLDALKRVTCGSGREKIAVHLDLDRQLFPVATPAQLEDHIMECVETLYRPEGGLSLFAEIAEDVPLENIEAILRALEKARAYR